MELAWSVGNGIERSRDEGLACLVCKMDNKMKLTTFLYFLGWSKWVPVINNNTKWKTIEVKINGGHAVVKSNILVFHVDVEEITGWIGNRPGEFFVPMWSEGVSLYRCLTSVIVVDVENEIWI